MTHNSETTDPVVHKLETCQVWKEAGFIPPAFYLKLVEFMHRRSMEETDEAPPDLSTEKKTGFVITDPQKLRKFAASCNIRWKGRNTECVAIEILIALLNDYSREKPVN